MFQVTEIYPRRMTRWLAPGLFALLLAWSGAILAGRHSPPGLESLIAILLLTGYGLFAITTVYLLWHRKRPQAEATTLFWHTAMISLLGCAALGLAQSLAPGIDLSLPLGVLFIVGFGYSAINGMLYKIVPFLVWYHLQQTPAAELRVAPKVKHVIADPAARRQFRVHAAALLLLAAASRWPPYFTHAAALALAVSSCWLWINLLRAMRLYRRVRRIAGLPVVVAQPPDIP